MDQRQPASVRNVLGGKAVRRLNKEYIRLIKDAGMYELLCEVREDPVEVVMDAADIIKENPLYKEGSARVRFLIKLFYGLAVDHAYGLHLATKKGVIRHE